MVDAAPFVALRYDVSVAGDPASTSAPAYDDLERLTYARHRTASPYTVLELLAPGAGHTYERSGQALQRWRRTGVLVEDGSPAYYLYEEHELRHGVPAVQRGVMAAVAVGEGGIYTHEEVDDARVADRLERLSAVPVDLAPIFAVYPHGTPRLRSLLRQPPREPPVVRLTDEAGIDHRIWRLRDPADVEAVRHELAGVDVVIADGHHRFAAARRFDPHGRTLMYLVDAHEHGPQILPVHRIVVEGAAPLASGVGGALIVNEISADVTAMDRALRTHPGRVWGLRAGGRSYLMTPRNEQTLQAALPRDRSRAWRSLDTAVFEQALLPLLVPSRGSLELRYTTDLAEGIRRVDASGGDALVVFRPVTIEAVYACATARDPMPPKTTWFRPKPRAGLMMRSLDSA